MQPCPFDLVAGPSFQTASFSIPNCPNIIAKMIDGFWKEKEEDGVEEIFVMKVSIFFGF